MRFHPHLSPTSEVTQSSTRLDYPQSFEHALSSTDRAEAFFEERKATCTPTAWQWPRQMETKASSGRAEGELGHVNWKGRRAKSFDQRRDLFSLISFILKQQISFKEVLKQRLLYFPFFLLISYLFKDENVFMLSEIMNMGTIWASPLQIRFYQLNFDQRRPQHGNQR